MICVKVRAMNVLVGLFIESILTLIASGKGHYTWPDGASYQGEFREGQHNGYGVYQFADGSKYSGEWSEVRTHIVCLSSLRTPRFVVLKLSLASFLFHQGLYNGNGTLEWSDGRIYSGAWQSGQAHGFGKEVNPDGSIRHEGEWSFDRPVRSTSSRRSARR